VKRLSEKEYPADAEVKIKLEKSEKIKMSSITHEAANQEPSNRLSNPSLNGVVSLNVGGTKFETTRQTFLNDPNSMLAKMFDPVSPMQPGVKIDGAYFIDRDPTYFRIVLNYLRSGQLHVDSNIPLEAIKSEASYFGLVSLEKEIIEKIQENEENERLEDRTVNDEFLLNVGGEIFVTTKETLCKYKNSRLSNLVEGKCPQQFDKNGILFLDEDPKDFAYILRALRNSPNVPTSVPKEHIDNILNLRDNLEIREIKFGYREQSNSFVSEYFLSVCSYENHHQRGTMTYGPGNELGTSE